MQSLASLAVERHAMDPREFAWRLRGSTPSGFKMPGVEWKMQSFCTSPRLEMSGNLRL